MWVQSLGQEDPLKEGRETYFNIPACSIPWTESLVGYSPRGHKESRHNWSDLAHTHNLLIQKWFPRPTLSSSTSIFSNVTFSVSFSLLLFSRSVMSNTLQSCGLQHARLPHPSLSPRACSNSCLLNQWCHSSISSSVVPFSCLQSFPTSVAFPMKIPRTFQRKDCIEWPKYWFQL